MKTETWKKELRSWANDFVRRFIDKPGILGVVIGGSVARGQEWRHSDLEMGVLVEEKNDTLPYFHIDSGHGAEVIQLVRTPLEEQIGQIEAGDLSPVGEWPIQLWKCRIVHDPSGTLGRFKKAFDSSLFTNGVVEKRIEGLRATIKLILTEARDLLAQNKPAAAMVKARWAMNEAILALHWACGELPRSQNRTDSRLRLLCKKHSAMPFYFLYREVFSLSETTYVTRTIWPTVRDRAFEIISLRGNEWRDFFLHAIDSEFKWRQNAGILTVYRLFVPIMGDTLEHLDDKAWAEQNKCLMRFLGLENLEIDNVSRLVERIAESRSLIEAHAQSQPSRGIRQSEGSCIRKE